MPKLPTAASAGRMLAGIARAAQVRGLEEGLKPHLTSLRKIRATHISLFITNGRSLHDVIPTDIADSSILQGLLRVPPDVLLEVLGRHHPALARVLRTVDGMSWWEQQRADFKR